MVGRSLVDGCRWAGSEKAYASQNIVNEPMNEHQVAILGLKPSDRLGTSMRRTIVNNPEDCASRKFEISERIRVIPTFAIFALLILVAVHCPGFTPVTVTGRCVIADSQIDRDFREGQIPFNEFL